MTGADAHGSVVWRHGDATAHVESPGRVALVSLSDLAAPPMLLTDSAAAIWQLLDGSRDIDEVVAALVEAFEVEASDIRPDVVAFIADLAARDLIVKVSAVTPSAELERASRDLPGEVDLS